MIPWEWIGQSHGILRAFLFRCLAPRATWKLGEKPFLEAVYLYKLPKHLGERRCCWQGLVAPIPHIDTYGLKA
jgi:hypothetical protein